MFSIDNQREYVKHSHFVAIFSFILIYPLHSLGLVYFGFATILGITFIVKAWQLLQQPEDKETAKSMFKYSILYMMLLCTGIVIDTLPNINQYTIF